MDPVERAAREREARARRFTRQVIADLELFGVAPTEIARMSMPEMLARLDHAKRQLMSRSPGESRCHD